MLITSTTRRESLSDQLSPVFADATRISTPSGPRIAARVSSRAYAVTQ
jgi:hypothetical protein